MTIEQELKNMLMNNAVPSSHTDAIINKAKETESFELMEGRWGDSSGYYNQQFKDLVWSSLRQVALEYIDENIPKAWFRPAFV